MRNPVWTREELVLVLALYYKLRGSNYSADHPDVIKMSTILNSLKIHDQENKRENFRNPNGISMRLMNFRSYDSTIPGVAMKNGGKSAKAIWDEFELNQENLFKEACEILNNHEVNNEIFLGEVLDELISEEKAPYYIDDIHNECPFVEGKIKYELHKKIERNPRLIQEIKREAEKKNQLYCHVFNFDFYKVYGNLGKGYIECHHSIPISEYVEEQQTKKEDIVLVCANCHRMLHRKRPWIKKDDIKSLIKGTLNNDI